MEDKMVWTKKGKKALIMLSPGDWEAAAAAAAAATATATACCCPARVEAADSISIPFCIILIAWDGNKNAVTDLVVL